MEIYYLLNNCCWKEKTPTWRNFVRCRWRKLLEICSIGIVTDQIWNEKFLRLNVNNLIFQIGTKPYAYGPSYFRLYVFKCGDICSYNVTKVSFDIELILMVLLRFLPIFPSPKRRRVFIIKRVAQNVMRLRQIVYYHRGMIIIKRVQKRALSVLYLL